MDKIMQMRGHTRQVGSQAFLNRVILVETDTASIKYLQITGIDYQHFASVSKLQRFSHQLRRIQQKGDIRLEFGRQSRQRLPGLLAINNQYLELDRSITIATLEGNNFGQHTMAGLAARLISH